MVLSWADRRLGAMEHDVLPLQETGAGVTSERDRGLHVVRDADPADAGAAFAATVTRWIDRETGRGWGSSPEYEHRATRERQYCEQIRDAKADGRTPLSADEFFCQPRT